MVWFKYSQRRLGIQSGLQGGHQVGLQGGPLREYFREYLMEVKVFRWTQVEVIWVRNGQGWFQLRFKGSTLHFNVDFTPHISKVKSHLKFTELDINASQACQ